MAKMDKIHTTAELFLTVYPRFKRLLSVHLQKIEDEITLSRMRTLGKLVQEPITLSELAERCDMTRAGASLQVQYLVEHGWVRRTPDPTDRRSPLLEVTEAGRAQWLIAQSQMIEYVAGVFEHLTSEEVAAVQTAFLALQRILEQVDSRKQGK